MGGREGRVEGGVRIWAFAEGEKVTGTGARPTNGEKSVSAATGDSGVVADGEELE
jgi:hypothetical protein